MSFKRNLSTNTLLPFPDYNCSDCPLKAEGKCDGIDDLKNYSMEHLISDWLL